MQTHILAHIERSKQVALQHRANILWVDTQRIVGIGPRRMSPNISPSIVDQNIDVTKRGESLAHEDFDLMGIRQIGCEKGGPPAKCPNLLCHRLSGEGLSKLSRRATIHVMNDDISPHLCQMP